MRNALLAGLLSLLLTVSFVSGFLYGHPSHTLASLGGRVVDRLGARLSSAKEQQTETRRQYEFESIFLGLRGDAVRVPTHRRNGNGGGLTSFGNEVLLLTFEGRLFAATGPDDLRELDIGIPDNGFEAYRRASESEEFKDYLFVLGNHRYNDIIHFDSQDRRGLAISYTEYLEESRCYHNTVAVLDLDPTITSAAQISAAANDWSIVFRSQPCLPLKQTYQAMEGHMAGGRMAFQAPATLYLTSGDYYWDGTKGPEAIAQRLDWEYGKVIRIDLSTQVATVFSSGHRNPQGIAFDDQWRLWTVEHGPRGGDELNLVLEGADYGWPQEILGTNYSRLPVPGVLSYGRHQRFSAPILAWLPSIAPSGLTLIDGFHPSWDGDLLVATLGGRSLYRLRIVHERVQFAERIDLGIRVRYVHQHVDGRLVLWTDAHELIFLSEAERSAEFHHLLEVFKWVEVDAGLAGAVETTIGICMECHSLVRGVHGAAPSLGYTFDQPIASSGFEAYSDALRQKGGKWTRQALREYLRDPQGFAPGTTMPDTGIEEPGLLDAIVEVLVILQEIEG